MAEALQEEELDGKPCSCAVSNAPPSSGREPSWKASRCALAFVKLDLIGKENISVLISGSEMNCSNISVV